jgi:hypothetical protein
MFAAALCCEELLQCSMLQVTCVVVSPAVATTILAERNALTARQLLYRTTPIKLITCVAAAACAAAALSCQFEPAQQAMTCSSFEDVTNKEGVAVFRCTFNKENIFPASRVAAKLVSADSAVLAEATKMFGIIEVRSAVPCFSICI